MGKNKQTTTRCDASGLQRCWQVAAIKTPSVLLNSVPPSLQDQPQETCSGPQEGTAHVNELRSTTACLRAVALALMLLLQPRMWSAVTPKYLIDHLTSCLLDRRSCSVEPLSIRVSFAFQNKTKAKKNNNNDSSVSTMTMKSEKQFVICFFPFGC